MEVDQEVAPVTSKKKNDKSGSPSESTSAKKSESPSDSEDPKPRIVLTFRSEKSGAKNSAMKIVPPEEKQEDSRVIPRRSCKQRQVFDETEYVLEQSLLGSPDKKKKKAQKVEKEEVSDSSPATPKRSTRRRSREFDVVASAIARKEKSYNETPAPTRPSRRIKPTAKILANEELRLECQKVPGSDKSPEEGVRTRRSVRGRGNIQDESPQKKEVKETEEEDEEDNQNQVMKLKHLCELGLKAIGPEDTPDDSQEGDIEAELEDSEPIEIDDEGTEDEEIDDDTEVISKLLEADAESIEEDDYSGDSDDEYPLSKEVSRSRSTRRSTRLQSGLQTDYRANDSDRSSPALAEDDDGAPRRRSTRKRGFTYHNYDDIVGSYKPQHSKRNRPAAPQEDQEADTISEPAAAEEGSEAACPPENSAPIALCTCETVSNVYAAQEDLKEPIFCQAIELVDGVRVGCSHGASRTEGSGGSEGSLAPLVRAGLRAPYFLACQLHLRQIKKHMCCPTCGMFCTQGTFYQCSKGHLFHLECGLPFNENSRAIPGCPHCGMWSYRWKPVNRDCAKVKVQMNCSNKRIFLPHQREQCTPAYLGFSTLDPAIIPQEPVIPEDLLPPNTADLKRLCERPDVEEDPVVAAEALCDAILAGASAEEIVPKILSSSVNTPVASQSGATCVHCAARTGHLLATHLLHTAGADLNYVAANKTPLIAAVLALLEKDEISPKKAKLNNEKNAEDVETDQTKEEDGAKEEETGASEIEKPKEDDSVKDENLMKVIRYLVAAGCDVNVPGPDGMTALHIAAQHGSLAVCRVLLAAGAEPDARDLGGWTPLVWAAEHQHHHVVKLLLSMGADAGSVDCEGNGVVHWCSLAGAARSLLCLLDADPKLVHEPNKHTDTPLHVAARQGHYACVVILLARGAKADVQNSAGELPMDVCEGQCRAAIALNMQMTAALGDKIKTKKILSSDISHGRERYPIPCVNEVDDTPLPDDFKYVAANVMPQPLNIDMTMQTLQGCTCTGDCSASSCACCVLGVSAWFRRGALPPGFPFHNPPMLFECNHTCQCHAKKCANSVITRLCKEGSVFVPSSVFRTLTRGWGLRAGRAVRRGAPVAAYVGELLATADADTRARDQYMFALDIKQDLLEQCSDKTQLCVDAGQFGGGARFINHSCRPNLVPVRVFTTTRDLRVPTVTLFAAQDIAAGQEFTFDYGDKFWSVKSKWLNCECGAVDCRYPAGKSDNNEP